jgi:hypothetical protein
MSKVISPRRIKTKEQVGINELICKYSKNIPINSSRLVGNFTISSCRNYVDRFEVDLIFDGKIFCRKGNKKDWRNKGDFGEKLPKIRLTRLFRKYLFDTISHHLKIFSVEMKYFSHIVKIEWV